MGFLGFKNEYDKFLERKKEELVSLNINEKDIESYVANSKQVIKSLKKEGLGKVELKLESLKSLEIKLQELRKLKYDDGDIIYLRKKGIEEINSSVFKEVFYPEDFNRLYSMEIKYPEESRKNILEKRLSPEEYLEKELRELEELGYTKEDINEFRKKGLQIIKENKNEKNSITKEMIRINFAHLKKNAEKRKKEMAEARVTPEEYLERELKELEKLGYTKEDIKEFRKEGLKIIESNKNEENSITKEMIRINFASLKKDVEKRKKEMAEARVTPEQRKEEILKKLENAGYGKFIIEEFRQKIEKSIKKLKSKGEDDKLIKSIIEHEVAGELAPIKKKQEWLNRNIQYILEREPNKFYKDLYGEKANVQKEAEIAYEKIKCKIICGHDNFKELESAIELFLKSYGYGESQIKVVKKELKDSYKEEYTDRINNIDNLVSRLICENNDYISLFENYKKFLVVPANIYYGTDKETNTALFIKEFLSKSSEEKNEFIKLINEKLRNHYMNNREGDKYYRFLKYLSEDGLSDEEKEEAKILLYTKDQLDNLNYSHLFSDIILQMRILEDNKEMFEKAKQIQSKKKLRSMIESDENNKTSETNNKKNKK